VACEFTFGSEPILQVTAGFFTAFEINFVCATLDFLLMCRVHYRTFLFPALNKDSLINGFVAWHYRRGFDCAPRRCRIELRAPLAQAIVAAAGQTRLQLRILRRLLVEERGARQ
jgi:hypothetical protein